MADILVKFLLFLVDGGAFGAMMFVLITYFNGYKLKNNKSYYIVGGCITFLFSVLFCVLSLVQDSVQSVVEGTDLSVSSPRPIFCFAIAVLCFVLLPIKKWKAALITLSAMEVLSIFRMLSASVGEILISNSNGAIGIQIVATLLQAFLPMVPVGLFAFYSAKKRREPMRLTIIITILIIFLVLEEVFAFFMPFSDDQDSIVTIQLLYDWEKTDRLFSIAVDVIVIMLILLTMFLVVKASEALFYRRKDEVNEYYLETQRQYYENLSKSNEEIRKIKHDMKNHMYCLQELSKNGDYVKLQGYVEDLSQRLTLADTSVHVGNPIADAILSDKKRVAEEKEIAFTVQGDLQNVSMAAIDLCTILANVLDNAIEATEGLERENRKIIIEFKKNENFLLICEKNTSQKQVRIANHHVETTKKDARNHGFGLTNIKEAVSKYEGECNLNSEVAEDGIPYFEIEILIPTTDTTNS